MKIDIAGEDPVTQAVIERLLTEYRDDLTINNKFPVRGGQIKIFAPKYNKLKSPIFLLTDLDGYNCPPELIRDWFGSTQISDDLLFRIAQDEAESWLMSDIEGFAKWLEIDTNLIPKTKMIDKKKGIFEIRFPYKPSLFLMNKLAINSRNKDLKDALSPLKGAKKGPAYNSTILSFIYKSWNIKNAVKNSYSLSVTIERLVDFKK
ncbi:MAG: hypothetical protein HZA79_14855 [Sphingobacteriales bacterium]|nr:hypothetical protein [Sphingobacteriales bacterium]